MLKKKFIFILLAIFFLFTACEDKGKKPVLLVLPFQNLNGNENLNFLSLGLADEIINKLTITKKFETLSQDYLMKNLELSQSLGHELKVEKILDELSKLQSRPDYVVSGSFRVRDKSTEIKAQGLEWLILEAKVIRHSDRKELAKEREENDIRQWNVLRGALSIKIAKAMGLPLSGEEEDLLKEANTREFIAFQENYRGKIFYYKSISTQNSQNRELALKYKNMAMFFFAKSLEADRNYRSAKFNYAMNFNPVKAHNESEPERRQRAQYKVNRMVIYAFQYKKESVYDISAWLNEFGGSIKTIIETLPRDSYLEIQGHTDASGPEKPWRDKPGNIKISENRARMIYDQLVSYGVPKDKLRYRGYGSLQTIPWIDKRNPANRRVTFRVGKNIQTGK